MFYLIATRKVVEKATPNTRLHPTISGGLPHNVRARNLRREPFSCVMAWGVRFLGLSGGDCFDADGVGPLGDVGVSFFHRHACILHKHLRAFAATPGEIAEEVLPADAVRAGWGIDSRLAAFNPAGQIWSRKMGHCLT
jgi:hypothetical protein